VIAFFNLFRLILLFLVALVFYPFCKEKAIYWFFYRAGPSFIKLGQVLSVREDLIGQKLANKLAKFQDQTKPSCGKLIKKILHKHFQNIDDIFAEFNYQPIASASIAQVHKAKLKNGSLVAVKILHPNINKVFYRDIKTIDFLAKIVNFFSDFYAKTLCDIVNLLNEVAKFELNLLQEASNASQLKENLANLSGFYVPKIFWQYCSCEIMVSEWLDAIAFSDKIALANSDIDKTKVAKNLVLSYFHQVYEDGFFHADMHPGNLFLLKNGDIAVVDFGIMGKIDKQTRLIIAKILIAFLHKNYLQVAKLHIEGGLVPKNTNLQDLSLACRQIGEMIVDVDVKSISLAKLLSALIVMTKNYQMSAKPELLLLQKTLLLVEGVGVALNPNLNIWSLARPWVKNWAKVNIGFDAKICNAVLDVFRFLKNKIQQ